MRRTLLGIGMGLLAFVLACEALFRVLPVSTATMTGYYRDPLILSYPAHHRWTMSTGWDLRNPQTLQSNALGFPSEREFLPDPRALVLVGDSYVEASMLPLRDRPGPQLERALGGGRPVYPMGGPGSSLLDYAERVRFAHQTLGVRDFVLLVEPGDVRQGLCNSGNVHGVCLDPADLRLRTQTLPPPSVAKRLLRHSAVAQYLSSQLKVDFGRLARTAFARDVPDHPVGAAAAVTPALPMTVLPPARAQVVDAVVDAFFARLDLVGPDLRLIVVADGPRGSAQGPTAEILLEQQRFLHRLRQRGIAVVEGQPLFAAHLAQSPLSLSVGPYDGHLNALGVKILMEAAAREVP